MKTTNQIKGYALLGLIAALSLNLSSLWQGIDGSSTDASTRESRRQDFKSCLKAKINAASLSEQKAECTKKVNGREFKFIVTKKVSKKITRKNKDGVVIEKTKSSGTSESFADALRHNEVEDRTEDPSKRVVQDDIIAKITVAADCDCITEETRTLSHLDKDFNNLSDLAREMDAMLLAANIDVDKDLKKEREENRIAKGYKNCRNDEEGNKYKRNSDDIEDYFSCVDYQSDNLEGRELASFMNDHVFPAAMQSLFYDPDRYQRYMEILGSNDGNGMVNATLDNLDNFRRDFLNRGMVISQTEEDMKAHGFPDSTIRQELNRINSLFDKQISADMRQYAKMQPALSSQYFTIDQTMKTGIPPYSQFGLDGGSSMMRTTMGIGGTSRFNSTGGSFGIGSAYNTLGLSSTGTRSVPSDLAARNRRGG